MRPESVVGRDERELAMIRALALAALAAFMSASPAAALTMKECGAKFRAAKKANTLAGMKWNDFRKTECGDEDVSDEAAASAVSEPDSDPDPDPAPVASSKAAAAAPKPVGRIVFPRVVDPNFADESAGKARLMTCARQYNANKAAQANGGLVWIQAGGGYWSLCNKRLKGG